MLRRLKQAFRRARLAALGIREEALAARVLCGEADGAWMIDPTGLGPDSVVYSVGLGTDITFDLDLIRRWGVQVFGFDPTPGSLDWLSQQSLPPQFHLTPVGLGAFDGQLEFFAPRRETSPHFSPVQRHPGTTPTHSAPVRKLETLVRDLGHSRIDILKIDIEGGEYELIADLCHPPVPVGQLLLEFHHNYRTIPLARTVEALDTLRRAGWKIFAISPRTYEFSLRR